MNSCFDHILKLTGLTIDKLLDRLELNSAELELVVAPTSSYLLHKGISFDLLLERIAKANHWDKNSALEELAKRVKLSTRTLQRAEAGKDPLKGETIVLIALELIKPFTEFADPWNPVEHNQPGPKRISETLPTILDEKVMRIIYTAFPELWKKGGVVAQLLQEVARIRLINLDAVPVEDAYMAKVLLKGTRAQVGVGTLDNSAEQSGCLNVADLVEISMGVLVPKGVDPEKIARPLDGSLPPNAAVFRGGYASKKLERLGVSQKNQFRFPDLKQMADSLASGQSDYAIGNLYCLREIEKQLKGFVIAPHPSAFCHYSVWVRKGEKELCSWLRDSIIDAQANLASELLRFNEMHAGVFRTLRHSRPKS